MSDWEIDGENIVRRIAGTFTFMWLIAAALMPAKGSEAGQPEQSQGGTMQITQATRDLGDHHARGRLSCAAKLHVAESDGLHDVADALDACGA
jgi:hypothetical protein